MDPRLFAAWPGPRPRLPRLLFAALGAAVLWSIHLGVVYLLVTIDCISPWNGGTAAVLVATALFAAGAAASGWLAAALLRELRATADPAETGPSEGDRIRANPDGLEWMRFLLLVGVAAGVLFTAVIILEGLSPLLVSTCP